MRIILIHGFNSSPEMNFHPWLKEELEGLGFEVVAPKLPLSTKDELDLPGIIEEMKSQVGYLKNDDIMLGHSLGAFVVLQYLEAVEMTETPRAVVLVAAPWKVQRAALRGLFIADLDADVLMWKAREFVVVHSKDDELVPFEHGQKLASHLKAKLVEAENDGHYMEEQYPILLETIKEIASREFEYSPGEGLDDDFKDIKE
jgi:uncharacterized protein